MTPAPSTAANQFCQDRAPFRRAVLHRGREWQEWHGEEVCRVHRGEGQGCGKEAEFLEQIRKEALPEYELVGGYVALVDNLAARFCHGPPP